MSPLIDTAPDSPPRIAIWKVIEIYKGGFSSRSQGNKMPSIAPVALFGYDRDDHLQETIAHLQANEFAEKTAVYVFSDAAKNAAAEAGVHAVRQLARSLSGFESVTLIERDTNWGLRRSMIDGVAQVSKKHGRVIVLEDDIVTNPCFLRFMNEALEFYKDCQTVGSISGYVADYVSKKAGLNPQDTFFHYRTNCWGWATWFDRWAKADWEATNWQLYFQSAAMRKLLSQGGGDFLVMLRDSMEGRNQSWMARWYYHCFLHGMLTLYPGRSLVDNIGFDGRGTHSRNANASACRRYRTPLEPRAAAKFNFALPVRVDEQFHKAMKRFWDPPWLRNTPLVLTLRPLYHQIRKLWAQRKP